jgi:CRP/FNR family transcriptional regulator
MTSKNINKNISEFFSKYETIEYKKGESILSPGNKVEAIYNIETGYVKSFSVNEDGDSLVINIYKPNSFFPITEALAGRINPYFFEAATPVFLQKAPVQKVFDFIKSDKEVLFDLTRRISIGLEGFMVRTQYLLRSNAKQKVSSTLVLLCSRFGEKVGNKKYKILLPQTHEDIANLSGTSRETASTELMKLKRSSTIEVDKKIITILDLNKLKDLSAIYFEEKQLPYNY